VNRTPEPARKPAEGVRLHERQRSAGWVSARYGSNALILSVAAIGIVVLLNILSARYYRRLDVTEGRLHSLSPQSLQILDELEGEAEVIGFYPSGQGRDAFERWLEEYQAHTDKLRYRAVDPIRQPGEADRLGWDAYGPGLLVRHGNRSQQVLIPDEQDITSALLKVSRQSSKVVYFLSGHNERSPADDQSTGYGNVAALLADNNYQVHPLNLAVAEGVPDDAALLVIAGPRTPLLTEEAQWIQAYLLAGGKALLLVDPVLREGAGSSASLNDLLEPWQVRFADRAVVDPQQSLGGDPLTPALTEYGFHQITKDLANTLIALPVAAPIQLPDLSKADTPALAAHYEVLATTSERSWGEADIGHPADIDHPADTGSPSDIQGESFAYDEGTDLPGPLVLVATVEGTPGVVEGESTRLVLIGDSDLARNDVLSQIPSGQFLLLNAVNWLAEEETLIAIGPKTNQPQSLRLSRLQEGAVCLGSLVLIPAGIALAGLIVWSRRRRPPMPEKDHR
jgi:ABC-type uncharacterized transport system involved in gliding motility auxiliary subunit